MSSVVIVIAGVAIVAYTIGSQLIGTAIRAKRLIVLPGIVTVVGAVNLSGKSIHPSGTDIALIAVGALIAALAGLGLGAMLRLEERDGWLWGKLPLSGLWLWVAFFSSRGVLVAIASSQHAHVASSTHAELLILGINRLGQAAVVGGRAYLSGTPFAPERDGSRPFGNLFGSARLASPAPGRPAPTAGGSPDQAARADDRPSARESAPPPRRISGWLEGGEPAPLTSRRAARRARRGRR